MALEVFETDCCVVGGGPAGMMLGYLLAREGIRVAVLEKHQDFFRDFRGDTVHPSALEVLNALGLLGEFLNLQHEEVESLGVTVGDSQFDLVDFRRVPATCKFVALIPQWDFLNFLSAKAKRFPSFQLLMQHEVTDLVRDGDRVTGVVVRNEGREMQIRTDLVIGCDGRHSVSRSAAGLEVVEHGVPIDVLWFRISRTPGDSARSGYKPQVLFQNIGSGVQRRYQRVHVYERARWREADTTREKLGAPNVTDRATFQAEMDALRVREKAHTHEGDAIAAARRQLQMVEVDATTKLIGRHGPMTLLNTFEGRRQLIAYYFMWHTGHPAPEQCEGCTWVTSQVRELSYIHSRDVTYAAFCQGPYEESARYRDFMGWQIPWYSAPRESLDILLVRRQNWKDAHHLLPVPRFQSLRDLLDHFARCRGDG